MRSYDECDSTPVLFTGMLLCRDTSKLHHIIILFSILLVKRIVYTACYKLTILQNAFQIKHYSNTELSRETFKRNSKRKGLIHKFRFQSHPFMVSTHPLRDLITPPCTISFNDPLYATGREKVSLAHNRKPSDQVPIREAQIRPSSRVVAQSTPGLVRRVSTQRDGGLTQRFS